MITPQQRQDYEALPAVLRALLDAEIAAGNRLTEVGHGFPAAPIGAYFMLAKPVSTRPRASGDGIQFYHRNSSIYAGEFTDAKRHFFILEAPNPAPPEPDMDAIRARANGAAPSISEQPLPATPPAVRTDGVSRFRESMVMNYERWHEGIGYDLDILKTAKTEELAEIENLLVSRGVSDWRDVEALAALNSPRAKALLNKTLKHGKREHAVAVLRYAPDLVNETQRTVALVAALEQTDFYAGLTQTLLEVEAFHPPEVIAALLRGVLQRKGEHACHFTAMLMYLHGKAKSSFDWELRPFFLKFNTPDQVHREQMFRELCQRIGANAQDYM